MSSVIYTGWAAFVHYEGDLEPRPLNAGGWSTQTPFPALFRTRALAEAFVTQAGWASFEI